MPRLQQRKRVLVVGAGAAGMSCADALGNHPDQFEVTLIDAQAYCGGQAFSIPIDKNKYGSEWMNQGVQGGSYIYQSVHTFDSPFRDVWPFLAHRQTHLPPLPEARLRG